MNNVNHQDHVPTHEIASSSSENTLQLAPETQQISATELTGERCQNMDVAATHPPATGDCVRALVEGRPTASSTWDPIFSDNWPEGNSSKLDEFDHCSTLVATAGSSNRDGFSIYHQNIRSVRHKVSGLSLSRLGPWYNLPHRTLGGRWGDGGNPTVFMCNIFRTAKSRGRWGGHF
ncbi:hypothetical protein J6590_080038 [Homalodisca vitripennis]|nr:hypothetical protein J6590_080038 [Homalodisca vitripennis]